MRTGVLTLVPALLCCALLAASGSAAKDKDKGKGKGTEKIDPKLAEAIEHFQNGVEFFGKGNFEAALVEFLKSYELNPAWELRYNIGICYDEMGEPVPAREWLRAYLDEGGEKIPMERVYEVEGLLDKLSKKVAYLTLLITPEDAEVMLGGKKVEREPGEPILFNPGIHELVFSKDGYEPSQAKVTLASGEKKTLEVSLEEIAKPEPPLPDPPPEPPVVPPEPQSKLSWAGFGIGAGAAGVFAIVAGVTGGLVLSTSKQMKSAADDCENTTSRATCPEAYDLKDRAQGLKIATNLFWGLTGAALVTGVVLLLTGQPRVGKARGEESQDSPALGFSVTPLLVPGDHGTWGLEMGLTF